MSLLVFRKAKNNERGRAIMYVGCWADVTYLRYTVLTSSKKSETAVHRCDPALSVLVMLVFLETFFM